MPSRVVVVLTRGITLVSLGFDYPVGANELFVSVNGKTLVRGEEYNELSLNQIVLLRHPDGGEILEARLA